MSWWSSSNPASGDEPSRTPGENQKKEAAKRVGKTNAELEIQKLKMAASREIQRLKEDADRKVQILRMEADTQQQMQKKKAEDELRELKLTADREKQKAKAATNEELEKLNMDADNEIAKLASENRTTKYRLQSSGNVFLLYGGGRGESIDIDAGGSVASIDHRATENEVNLD